MASNIQREKISFPNAQGQELTGLFERARAPLHGLALFAHCFTCSKNIGAATRISRELAQLGFGVLRFDFTGLGNSEGDFANTNFSSNVDDLVAAAKFLERTQGSVDLLVGHSLGGAAVLAAAESISSCRAVVTLGAPADPQHVTHLFADHLQCINEQGYANVCLAGRNFTIKKQFIEDVSERNQLAHIENLRKALLVMHSPVDEVVGISNAAEIYRTAKHPKSFISLDNADHLLNRPKDTEYVARNIAAWASRYLRDEEIVREITPPKESNELVVRERDCTFTNDVATRDHSFVADEPSSAGGHDLGPDPYKFLLASLGACTSMTLRSYAKLKDLPLEKVEVHLSHDKIHADDCHDCESKSGRIDQITRRITLTGDLSSSQRQRLLEIADRCPVHRSLLGEIKIRSELTLE